MGKKRVLSTTLAVLVLALAVFLARRPASQTVSGEAARSPSPTVPAMGTTDQTDAPVTTAEATSPAAATTDRKARESLNFMSGLLADAFQPSSTMKSVLQRLKDSGQNPFVTRSGDPATGRLMMIRTKSPLPGTRYFHAQYFTDEGNKIFVQHMSFEFRPGPRSMEEAVQTAARTFRLGRPQEQKADFIQWDLDDDYVLWIKKKSAGDLKDDPFNAYDPRKDVGTIQLAVEMKIHGDSHEGEGH